MNSSCHCSNCINLQLILNEKESEIEKLKLQIQNLKDLLLNYQNKSCHICFCKTKIENDKHGKHLTNNAKLTVLSVSPENETISQGMDKSKNSELIRNSYDSTAIESSYIVKDSKDTISEEVSDSNPLEVRCSEEYIYDENYKMYYCTSTGYYYDTNSKLYYVPQNGAYYTYDYTENAYVLYSAYKSEVDSKINNNSLQIQLDNEETNSSIKQSKEDPCESVVHQVNNLNICDTSDCCSKITNTQDISEERCSKDDEDKLHDENCLLEIQADDDVNVTCDWQPPDGTSLTVQDLVREVAEQNIGMSDYVYDESTRMYYSHSTGYYFDTVRNLLYDPKNGTYYSYDQESSSYNFYYQLDASHISTNKDENNVDTENEKKKARKRYWLKKQNESAVQCNEENRANNYEIEDVQNEDYSSPEEGEVFSSDSEEEVHCHVLSPLQLEQISNVRFPCIRAIVKCSEKLKIGTLILITYTGATIGRDKLKEVFIPDASISKAHAEVTFNKETWKYSIKDLGSQNGTFLNDTRLSKPKEESQSHILHHEDNVSIGSCKLLFHIHVGYETCDGCEPGQIMEELCNQQEECIPVFKTNEEKRKEWKKEARRIKKKYGLEGMDYINIKNSVAASGATYEDKAEIRRKTVGSENPYEKTEVASMERVMDKRNVGYQMLRKLGWKEGEALGSAGQGISEPIPLEPWLSKAGLGSSPQQQMTTQSFRADRKRKKWVKAQERFLLLS